MTDTMAALARCPVQACPVVWRDGATRPCADHDGRADRLADKAAAWQRTMAGPPRRTARRRTRRAPWRTTARQTTTTEGTRP